MADDVRSDIPVSTPEPQDKPSLSQRISDNLDKAYDTPLEAAADDKPASTRARDEHGKFAKQPEPPEGPATDASPAPTEQAPAAAPAALQAPPRWSDADKAAFTNLPPEAQKAILDRNNAMEADYTRKTMEVADQRKAFEPLVQAFGPHTDYLGQVGRQFGQSPAQLVSTLIGTERQLRTGNPEQRAQTLAGLIREYPVDLQLLNRALGQAPQPVVSTPMPLLNDLRQQLDDVKSWKEERELHDARARVEAFSNTKDEQGRPKYPHFDAVRDTMAPLVERGMSYDDAYQQAAKPIVDALAAHEAQTRAAFEASNKDRAAAVARAKQASSPRSNGSTPNGSVPPTLAQRISANLEKVGIA